MKLDSELAEVTGAILGDGCLSKYWVKKENRFRYELAFTGSLDDYEYYNSFVLPVIRKHFNVRSGRLFTRDGNSTRLHFCNKSIFNYFADIGVPIGEKAHKITMPSEMWKDKKLLTACLRGLFDTDGTVYRRYSKKYKNHPKHYSNLLVVGIKLKSKAMLKDIKEAFSLFSIDSNNIIPSGSCYVLRITKQQLIQRFLDKIGFRNSHHLKRLAYFKKDNLKALFNAN